MIHNLTDKQLKALRWLVKQISDNKIGERFVVTVAPNDKRRLFFDERNYAPPCMDIGVLDVLSTSEIIVRSPSLYEAAYTVTQKVYEIAAFDFDDPELDSISLYMREVYHLIRKHFNREELEGVCFELGFQPDWVFGDKTDWPLHLLLYLYRQNQLSDLPPVLEKLRTGVVWPKFPEGV